jgi:hypothetical protein
MKKFAPAVIAIDKDLTFSDKSVFLYMKLPAQPYEFLESKAREVLAQKIDLGLQGLVQSNDKSVEGHLIITSVPFDVQTWADKLDNQVEGQEPAPYWKTYFDRMQQYFHHREFRTKEVFIGVNLGRRSEYSSSRALGFLGPINDLINLSVGIKDRQISDKELEFWHKRAKHVKDTLGPGQLKAVPVTSNTIARLIKEPFWPDMRVPKVSANQKARWGKGEIDGLFVSAIENNAKYLKIEQVDDKGQTHVGYRATLCFSRFPDTMYFPEREPWMHYASLLSSPVQIFSRFTIEPAQKVKKAVDRMVKGAMDQVKNANGNAPAAVLEQVETAHQLEYRLSRERTPWIYARHRLVVQAPDKDTLYSRVQEVIDHYKNLDIDVTWPTGDQMDLLLESQPGDTVRSGAYYQKQELAMIPIGMPTGSGSVGDNITINPVTGVKKGWIGPYLGYTTSRVEEPVFLSLHSAIARDHPPGLVITGAPGGGKSFAAFTLTYLMALQNVWTIYIDPKGDALPMADLPGLEGRVKKFDLKFGHDGLLDPFTLSSDLAVQKLLALETIGLFQNGILRGDEETALIDAIQQVSKERRPSLYRVVDVLAESPYPDGKAMGGRLNLIRELPFARLVFDPNSGERVALKADDGLTIISLQSLDLPANSNKDEYTLQNRLAVGIMHLLTNFTESLMYASDKEHPKAVVIDEAWAITSTPQGKAMIPRLARMGRSLNTALVLVSQNAGDFLDLTNNMSYRMAFRAKDTKEIENVIDFFDLEHNDGNANTISGLMNGECIMKDPDDNISRVYIDSWDTTSRQKFDTNPATRGKKE